MKIQVRPEWFMIALRLLPATPPDMNNPAPPMIRPESTYKSGIVVQTTGATSLTRLCDALHFVGVVTTGSRRRKGFTIRAIKFDRLFNHRA